MIEEQKIEPKLYKRNLKLTKSPANQIFNQQNLYLSDQEQENGVHVKLWIHYTDQDKAKFKLWFKLFSQQDRAYLWNSLNYPLAYFQTLSESQVATDSLSKLSA